jgi:hypothetical protein
LQSLLDFIDIEGRKLSDNIIESFWSNPMEINKLQRNMDVGIKASVSTNRQMLKATRGRSEILGIQTSLGAGGFEPPYGGIKIR